MAMQLANILRDVREDMERGRIYLPQDELRRFGVSEQSLMTGTPEAGWEPLTRHEIERAKKASLVHHGTYVIDQHVERIRVFRRPRSQYVFTSASS